MNTTQILALARKRLDDIKGPSYLWEDSELIEYLEQVYQEWCEEVRSIRDSTTVAICQIPLLSNQAEYSYDPRIINVEEATLTVNDTPLDIRGEAFLSRFSWNWRIVTGTPSVLIVNATMNKVKVYPFFNDTGYVLGSSNVSFASGTNTITKVGETFTEHYAVGDSIVITGTTLNNATRTLATVGSTTMTTVEALVTEALTSALLQKVEDTLLMTVTRYPLISLSLSLPTASPEIHTTQHIKLIDGILREAYLKSDTQTYDSKASERFGLRFEESKGKAKTSRILLEHGEDIYGPHEGAI